MMIERLAGLQKRGGSQLSLKLLLQAFKLGRQRLIRPLIGVKKNLNETVCPLAAPAAGPEF